MGNDKNSVRLKMQEMALSPFFPGKIAECLRREGVYRKSTTIFVSPAPLLNQIRINALLDGKMLVMPGPAIKKGFYRLTPYATPFKDLGYAVNLKGIELFGTLLTPSALEKLHVDLALTDCLAVDKAGGRLGVGTGFFDMAIGILAEVGAVDDKTQCGAVGVPEQVIDDTLAQDAWDVKMNFFLQSAGLVSLSDETRKPGVIWDALDKKRVRKMEPLWQLYQEKFPLVEDDDE